MHLVRETSAQAHDEHHASGKAAEQKTAILNALGNREMTRRELAHATGIETSSVSGRVNEMLYDNPIILEECGKRKCSITGKMVYQVRLIPAGKQIGMF